MRRRLDGTASRVRKIRVLLVDDYKSMRDGLTRLLLQESDIEVVGEAENGRNAIDVTRELLPDVVIMDINMPVMNGIEATQVITRSLPGVCVIGLSIYDDALSAAAIIKAGAAGYVSKADVSAKLIETIRRCAWPRISGLRRA